MDYNYQDIDWQYHKGETLGVERDGVLYKIKWAPNTLADSIICALTPFPGTNTPGLLIDGDLVSDLDEEATKAFRDGFQLSPEELEAEEEREKEARAKASAEATETLSFLALRVLEVGPDEFAKTPRSAKELLNLLAVLGESHLVQLLGRSSRNELVMQRFGDSLTSWITNPSIEVSQLWRDQWALDLAMALQKLHSKGIVHRDLTLSNVQYLDNHAILCNLESGPMTYRPPEVTRQVDYDDPSKYDVRSDMFQFGLLLWSIQNRNMPPHMAWTVLVRNGTYGTVMDRCLQIDPSKRPTINEAAVEMWMLFANTYPDAELP